MEKINKNHKLIKDLFKDKLKRHDVGALSEIDIVEQSMQEQWKENAERIDPEIGEQIWEKILREYKVRSKRKLIRRIYYPLAAACVALVAVLGGWLFYMNSDFFLKEEFSEIVATQNMLYQLPDSSEVWMYPNSSIRFAKDFNKDRRVWLEGSSMFHVRKQHGNTFKVYIDKAFIEVKGTRFLVDKKEAGNNEITLFNGCVEFNMEATGKQVVMKPLEKIFYNSVNTEIKIQKIENIEWQDGKFKFDVMPLNRLISIINQMYHANIVYEGKDASSPFSGTIRQEETLDDIILKICFLMNLKEERTGNKIIIRN